MGEPGADPSLSISFTKLFGWLGLAEAHHQVTELRTGESPMRLPPGTVLKKRARSPEETLSLERERRFVESEEEAEERAMRSDETYRQETGERQEDTIVKTILCSYSSGQVEVTVRKPQCRDIFATDQNYRIPCLRIPVPDKSGCSTENAGALT